MVFRPLDEFVKTDVLKFLEQNIKLNLLRDFKMKSCKSYTCKISGNVEKVNFLNQTLEIVEDLSWVVFTLGTKYSKNWWKNQNQLYRYCRNMFPELNSKILQNFIKLYKPIEKKSLPKFKPIKSSIYVDYQSLDLKIDSNNKLTNFWLRFSRRNFPLFGKGILKKIKDPSNVKLVQIFKRGKDLYCKLSYVVEIKEPIFNNIPNKIIGLDVNTKRIVLSNNKFYHTKDLFHRKIENWKNNLNQRNNSNFTKDYLHKLTTQISKDLSDEGVEVLVLENLKGLRKSASRKLGTSKGKKLNYIINSMSYGMFQDFLEYKCLDLEIKVEKIQPAYTSKTCSKCLSRKTQRPKQEQFVCLDCNYQLDADLNGSRNIENFYRNLNGLPVNITQVKTFKVDQSYDSLES